MRHWVATLIVAVTPCLASSADAAIDIQKAPGFPGDAKMVVIAPLPCSEDVNCVKVERWLHQSAVQTLTAKLGLRIVSAEAIKKVLFEASVLEDPTREDVFRIARDIGCDAVLFPSILSSETKKGYSLWVGPTGSVQSTTELTLMTVEGKLLMRGRASADSPWQSNQTTFARTQFHKILKKAVKER